MDENLEKHIGKNAPQKHEKCLVKWNDSEICLFMVQIVWQIIFMKYTYTYVYWKARICAEIRLEIRKKTNRKDNVFVTDNKKQSEIN